MKNQETLAKETYQELTDQGQRHILLISSNSSSSGGGEKYLVYLAVGLRRLGCRVSAILSDVAYMDTWEAQLNESGAKVFRHPLKGIRHRPGRFLQSILARGQQKRLADWIVPLRPDSIIVNQQYDEDALDYYMAAKVAADRLGKSGHHASLAMTLHMPMTAAKNARPLGRLRGFLMEQWHKKWRPRIIFVSQGSQHEFHGYYKTELARVNIPNGVFDKSISVSTDNKTHAKNSDKRFYTLGCMGRFDPQKNLALLVAGWLELRERGHHCRLLMVGDGPLRPEIESLIRAADIPESEWEITGWVDDPAPYLERMDMFALTSDFEGLPLALLEVAGRGIPTATTPFNGLTEVREYASWLREIGTSTPSGVSDSFDAIVRGIESGKLAPSLADIQEFRDYFSVQRMAQETLNFLSKDEAGNAQPAKAESHPVSTGKPRVAIVYSDISPYHRARFFAAAKYLTLDVVEVGKKSSFSEFAWKGNSAPYRIHPLFPHLSYLDVLTQRGTTFADLKRALFARLDAISPQVLAIKGYSFIDSLMALDWARQRRCPVVLMSETQAADFARSRKTEIPKKLLLRQVSAALVGGTPHKHYLESLGISGERVFSGYDAVENLHFSAGSEKARLDEEGMRHALNLPSRYFLASGRMIPKKNFVTLLHAYIEYVKVVGARNARHLLFLGDGEERPQLEVIASSANLGDLIRFQGYQPFEVLPTYYSLADAFILPSYREQWGLVVNEAMASGCPVLVSKVAGCAPDLVTEGVNGWTFDPAVPSELTQHLLNIHDLSPEILRDIGRQGQRMITAWGPDRFAEGLTRAATLAAQSPRGPRPTGQGFLSWALQQRAARVFVEDRA